MISYSRFLDKEPRENVKFNIGIEIFDEDNSTEVKADCELITWFKEEYGHLEERVNIEVLWNATDLGVGVEDGY